MSVTGDRLTALATPPELAASKQRIVGVDAGGSATRVVLCADGDCTTRAPRPAMNALLTANIPELLAEIASTERASLVGAALPGVRSAGSAAALAAATRELCGVQTVIVSDVQAALAGAFLGAPGIVVAAGTGTVALGSNGADEYRAGGHGFLLGDEGGGYWIGKQGVISALRQHEGRGGSPRLSAAIVEHAGCDLERIVARVHSSPSDRALLAALAPVVTALASEDDEANRITQAAADHLAELAEAVTYATGPLPVAGVGGVFDASVIWERFSARCGAVRPQAPPTVGVALIAARSPDVR